VVADNASGSSEIFGLRARLNTVIASLATALGFKPERIDQILEGLMPRHI